HSSQWSLCSTGSCRVVRNSCGTAGSTTWPRGDSLRNHSGHSRDGDGFHLHKPSYLLYGTRVDSWTNPAYPGAGTTARESDLYPAGQSFYRSDTYVSRSERNTGSPPDFPPAVSPRPPDWRRDAPLRGGGA